MQFIETPVFTREVEALLSEDSYRRLQLVLMFRPEMGRLIPGTGGLRKVRWAWGGSGKRGGVRLIYYWTEEDEKIYMLMLYKKASRTDLTPSQARALRKLVERELR